MALPQLFSAQGVQPVIPALSARGGDLWVDLEGYRLTLYPYIAGHNAIQGDLSPRQWVEFGAALQKVHAVVLPPRLDGLIPRETWSPRWRSSTLQFLELAGQAVYTDPVAARCMALLREHRHAIQDLVQRAGRLAQALQASPPEFVLCHGDIHEANVLIQDSHHFYLVDWDDPVYAPRERDLMFIGGGICGVWTQAWQQ